MTEDYRHQRTRACPRQDRAVRKRRARSLSLGRRDALARFVLFRKVSWRERFRRCDIASFALRRMGMDAAPRGGSIAKKPGLLPRSVAAVFGGDMRRERLFRPMIVSSLHSRRRIKHTDGLPKIYLRKTAKRNNLRTDARQCASAGGLHSAV